MSEPILSLGPDKKTCHVFPTKRHCRSVHTLAPVRVVKRPRAN